MCSLTSELPLVVKSSVQVKYHNGNLRRILAELKWKATCPVLRSTTNHVVLFKSFFSHRKEVPSFFLPSLADPNQQMLLQQIGFSLHTNYGWIVTINLNKQSAWTVFKTLNEPPSSRRDAEVFEMTTKGTKQRIKEKYKWPFVFLPCCLGREK